MPKSLKTKYLNKVLKNNNKQRAKKIVVKNLQPRIAFLSKKIVGQENKKQKNRHPNKTHRQSN